MADLPFPCAYRGKLWCAFPWPTASPSRYVRFPRPRCGFPSVPIVSVELHENMEFACPPSIPPSGAQRASRVGRRVDGLQMPSRTKFAGAETLAREALTNWEKTRPDSWRRYHSEALLGAILAGQRRYSEAEALLISGVQGLQQREASVPADDRQVLRDAGEWAVSLYESWGKPESAAAWRDRARRK